MEVKKAHVRFNYQDYCLLPEGKRYEIIDGEIYVVPAPSFEHQDFLGNLYFLLRSFVRGNNLGVVVVAPFDVILSEEDVVQPDLVFISRDRLDIITGRGCEGPPDLVVEILSPGTAHRDRDLKRKLYARYGVQEYWLIGPDTHTIEVLALEGEDFRRIALVGEGDVLSSEVLSGLKLRVEEVFQATYQPRR